MNLPWMILAVVLSFAGGTLLGEWDGRSRANARWEAKVNQQIATDERAARAASTAHFRNMEVAYRANQLETQKLRDAAARADRAARGLRDDLVAIRQHVAGDSGAACPAALDACHAVLGDCSERYRGMAQAADEHAADARLCIDGWPR
jgi:hypothetical protein